MSAFVDLIELLDFCEAEPSTASTLQQLESKASVRWRIAQIRKDLLMSGMTGIDKDIWKLHDNIEMVEHCVRLGYWSLAKIAVRTIQDWAEKRGLELN